MPRFRGFRRACLLVTSALHLLADVPETTTTNNLSDDSGATVTATWEYPPHDDLNANDDTGVATATTTTTTTDHWATQRILEDEFLTKLSNLEAWEEYGEYGLYYNVVVPFRPPPSRLTSRPKSTNSSSISSSTPADVNQTRQQQQSTNLSKVVSGIDDAEEKIKEVAHKNIETNILVPPDGQEVRENQTNTTATEEQTTTEQEKDTTTTQDTEGDATQEEETDKRVKFDYASKSAGALILEKSAGWKGASSLLNSDNDRYAIIPCAETSKSVVISLSEDILVKNVVLANYERFSSTVKDFQLLGSQTMGKWVDLGTYTAKQGGGKQEFELYEHSWARYLKVRVLSYYGNEHYLTISQISVFGDTMLQGFHEHWEEGEKDTSDGDLSASEESDALENSGDEAFTESAECSDTEQEGSANPIELSEFTSNDPCTIDANLDPMCPKDLSFEQLVVLVSANQSQLERMSFLDSSFSCRSLSKYEHSDFPGIKVQSIRSVATIARETRQTSNEEPIVSTPDVEASVTIDTADSPVITQIQSIIKSTSGVDVDLSKINGLFHGQDADETKKEGSTHGAPTETIHSETVETSNGQSSEAGIAPSKEHSSISLEPKDAGRSATMNKDEWVVLLKALERVPSSACLKDIDFTEFRKRVASNKNGAAGAGNSQSAGSSVELQPIFKRLTDEIKTLQGTLAMQEDFLKSAVSCYQKVLLELVVQQEESRFRTEQRLENLEHALETYLRWVGFVEESFSAFIAILLAAFNKPWYSWLSRQLEHISDSVVIILVAITVLVSSHAVLFSRWSLVRRLFRPLTDRGLIRRGQEAHKKNDNESMPEKT